MKEFDLLSTVEQGGCSAKLSAKELNEVLKNLPTIKNENLLVDIETHDDAGVYKIRDDYALIVTTDFFPPVCSEAYEFGQIAAANALSDVYAMGGQVLTALNLMMFPSNLPIEILAEILKGGQNKVAEAGGVIAGGHTIADNTPKYGLAVTGWVHPENLSTNAAAKAGDILVLSKPIGTGVIIAAKKNNLCSMETYQAAINNMKHLNKKGAEVMNKYGVRCATDITGFGLLGHAMKLADASNVSINIKASKVPSLPDVIDLIDMGCIPGAAFRNLEFIEERCHFDKSLDYNSKMFLVDAQTSGGLMMCVDKEKLNGLIEDLKKAGYEMSAVIGEVVERGKNLINIKS